jgi:hypothetical protein
VAATFSSPTRTGLTPLAASRGPAPYHARSPCRRAPQDGDVQVLTQLVLSAESRLGDAACELQRLKDRVRALERREAADTPLGLLT